MSSEKKGRPVKKLLGATSTGFLAQVLVGTVGFEHRASGLPAYVEFQLATAAAMSDCEQPLLMHWSGKPGSGVVVLPEPVRSTPPTVTLPLPLPPSVVMELKVKPHFAS